MKQQTVTMSEYGTDLCSRARAREVRNLIVKNKFEGVKTLIDFKGVYTASCCFCDEIFGVLYTRFGGFWLLDNVKTLNANEGILRNIAESILERRKGFYKCSV